MDPTPLPLLKKSVATPMPYNHLTKIRITESYRLLHKAIKKKKEHCNMSIRMLVW